MKLKKLEKMKKVKRQKKEEEEIPSEEDELEEELQRKAKKKGPVKNVVEEDNEEMDEEDNDDDLISTKKHKEKLLKLKESDPEFFKFMQEEDADLLNFEDSDGEEGLDEEEDEEMADENEEEDEEEAEKKRKIPKAKKDGNGRLIFDGNHYDYLEEFLDPDSDDYLTKKPEMDDINFAVEAFQACIARVGADIEAPKYVINEQAIFESVVRICFRSLGEIFKRFGLSQGESEDGGHKKKNKQFKRYQGQIKQYLTGVLMFLNEVQSDAVIVSTLKVVQQMLDLFGAVPKISKNLIKVLVRIWTRKTLQCRLMAYICMNQLLKSRPEMLSNVYKSAYLGFVSNARDVSAETWPLLQFMHRTFAELTLVVPDSAYPYAFVYIRQTAIHLRNAIISKNRQDLVQTVYNWQLIQCLYLWVRVVSKAHSVNGAESICELAYPLTQIIIGVAQLHRAPRYLPLRFHCVSLLIQLQASCTTYIPVMALSSELLEEVSSMLNTKPKPPTSAVVKTFDLESIIKVQSQARDLPSFRATVCEHLFKLMLQAAHSMCSQPSFPDLCAPVLRKISVFLKKGRIGDNGRLFKGLAEKLTEHSLFVSKIMQERDVVLHDEMNVRAAKMALNNPDSPLRAYYRKWEKVWKMKQEVAARTDDQKKPVEKTKKKVVQPKEKTESSSSEKPLKKKKRISTPAAKTSDATLPDEVADLGDWSD